MPFIKDNDSDIHGLICKQGRIMLCPVDASRLLPANDPSDGVSIWCVLHVEVNPPFRNQGVARALLRRAADYLVNTVENEEVWLGMRRTVERWPGRRSSAGTRAALASLATEVSADVHGASVLFKFVPAMDFAAGIAADDIDETTRAYGAEHQAWRRLPAAS